MNDAEFEAIEPLLDSAADQLDALLDSDGFQRLKDAIQKISASLESMSVTLSCNIEIFDAERESSLRLLDMGITTADGDEPYRYEGDASFQRYVVSGDICQVPHDYCPSCWGMWDFKDQDRECPSCGIVLGNEIKILLDTDICPHCENGKVSAANPECSKCGYKVDLDIVTWG